MRREVYRAVIDDYDRIWLDADFDKMCKECQTLVERDNAHSQEATDERRRGRFVLNG